MFKLADFTKALLLIRSVGLGVAFRTFKYTLWKSWLDWRYKTQIPAQKPVLPGKITGIDPIPGGERYAFDNATLEVKFLAPDLARISWQPGESPIPYALAKTDWPDVALERIANPDAYTLASEALKISVQPDGSLTFSNPLGDIFRYDLPPQRAGRAWTALTRLRPEERLFGLGEQSGPLNIRKRQHRLWARDPGGSYGPGADPVYMPVPLYLSLHDLGSYLVFYENYSAGWATFEALLSPDSLTASPSTLPPAYASHALARFSFEQGMLRYYVIPGPPSRALERYTELSGRAGLPPIWSLGYHQSRWGYKTDEDIRRVVAGFKEHDLPISAIHLDIDYMDGFRVFTVDKDRFPRLDKLTQELKEQNIHTVVIIDPGVKQDKGYNVYLEGKNEHAFCSLPGGKEVIGLVWPGWSVYPDFTSPHTRNWWGQYYQRLIDMGVDGFWHDMNEPTAFAAWGDMTLPDATWHHLEGRGGDHRLAHNLYALLMNRAGYETLRRLQPQRRPWLISRSGWAGNQRYAWNWTGDIETSWEGLKMTIATVLGMSLSGFPFIGPDIGGFSGTPTAELYTRWLQMAVFLPFCRTHSALTTATREPWVFGEPYTTIIRRFLHLRYHLLPYLYTLAWEHTRSGAPIVRPLFWGNWEFADLWEVDDAFLLGDLLLVAPVLEEKATQREVTLPPGQWIHYWDDTTCTGPARITLHTPLEHIPVLVRAGSVLPQSDQGRLLLQIYPASSSDFPQAGGLLYSDAGDGYGASRLDRFHLERQGDEYEIRWEETHFNDTSTGTHPFPFPYAGMEIHLHGMSAERVWVDDHETQLSGERFQCERFSRLRWRPA